MCCHVLISTDASIEFDVFSYSMSTRLFGCVGFLGRVFGFVNLLGCAWVRQTFWTLAWAGQARQGFEPWYGLARPARRLEPGSQAFASRSRKFQAPPQSFLGASWPVNQRGGQPSGQAARQESLSLIRFKGCSFMACLRPISSHSRRFVASLKPP